MAVDMQGNAPIALTMGEPGGIGPEITGKAWLSLRESGPCFFLIGDPQLAEQFCAIEEVSAPSDAEEVFATRLPVLRSCSSLPVEPGNAQSKTSGAVTQSIETAVALVSSGDASAVVTNPIQKSALIESGFAFPGHTEFLGDLTKAIPMPTGRTRGPVMMLEAVGLRTVPVTVHQSVIDAAGALSVNRIVDVAKVTHETLVDHYDIASPRIVISGLNPHAGENGNLGKEDAAVIEPAVKQLNAMGLNVFGPLPADTMFHATARTTYDAAVCMLHDQALIPVKTLAFDEAVNVTIGLPIIRTSPDHGTALDIAGKGIANPSSLIAAIRLAGYLAGKKPGARHGAKTSST
ncbi:MAG: 4-hydroxythreonine-4-phosphate dehydrogenase PdxA [Pseudomonadota bacterium]